MAKSNLYDVYNPDGRIIKSGIQRNELAHLTGYSYRTVDEKTYGMVPGMKKNIGQYTVELVVTKRLQETNNFQVKAFLADGKWDRVCEPFRKLAERKKQKNL